MKNWLVGLLALISTFSWAQPENATTEVVGGKKYYVHLVQSGNTLWGIHTLYNVPVEDIVSANPGVEKGVNVTLGLPLIRTSPDHGTAFDIAGTAQADASSLLEALRVARKLAGVA